MSNLGDRRDDGFRGRGVLASGEVETLVCDIPCVGSEAPPAHDRFASQVMQAPIPMAILLGPDLIHDVANPLYEEMIGRAGVRGRPLRAVLADVARDASLRPLVEHVRSTGEAAAADEYRVSLTRGGKPEDVTFKVSCQPMRDEAGALFGVMIVAVDVTDQVRVRRELEASSKLLQAVVNQMPAGIVIAEAPSGRIVLVNERVSAILGAELPPAQSIADYAAYPAVHEDGSSFAPEEYALARALRGETVLDEEVAIDTRKAPRKTLSVSAAPVRDTSGRIVAAINSLSDVTERKQADDQRQQMLVREGAARAEAEIANRAKDEFLAMLGHELRNPLTPILTALDLMRNSTPEEAERARMVIERQVGHMVHLIDDLLDVSRIARGSIELKKARVEIADVVSKAIEMASPILEQREQNLTVNVPRVGLAVDGDVARLAQVVSNLLTNAAKYTERHGRVTVTAALDGGRVVVRVADTGIGISAEMLPRIFDLFVQERQAIDRAHGGLGLGLAIVRNIVAAHGGAVSAHSAGKGQGSEFVVRLPMATSAAVPARNETPSRMSATPMEGAVQLRILVVDDNEDAAKLLSVYLRRLGHTIQVAHDGAAALRLAKTFMPEVALLDIGLPVMDGYELARRLREVPGLEHIPLVAITGYGQETDRGRSREAGFDAHLVKPVDPTRFKKLLHDVTQAREEIR